MVESSPQRDAAAPEPSPGRVWPAFVTVVSLASLPFLAVLGDNFDQGIAFGRVLGAWAIAVGIGVVAVALAWARSRAAARRVAVVVGVALWLFFHFREVSAFGRVLRIPLGELAWWGLFSSVVLLVVVLWLSQRRGIQLFAALVAPALLLAPAFEFAAAAAAPTPAESEAAASVSGDLPVLERRPDVWVFVLDGYAGPEFLRTRADHDPTAYLDHLRDVGFTVSEEAESNYPFTHLSVSALLDMEYVYEDVPEPGAGPYFERLQGDNKTVDTFLANGYGYSHAYPGLWAGSKCGGRQDYCHGDTGILDETTHALVSVTPLVGLLADEDDAAAIATINDPLHVTRRVLAGRPEGPTFNFIHMLNPHPPLFRDADCNLRDLPSLRLSLWGDGPEYGDAVACLERRLQAAVDEILAVDEDPVIVIQGDHGSRLGIDWDVEGGVLLDDDMYFTITSAVRLPEECADVEVPADLTPVNTMRIVFACLQDEPVDLLDNRRYPIHREG